MLAFVTGATGFLGSHVARVLAEQGAELRLLVRPTSDLRNIEDLNADRVVGDLRDAASIAKALSGCDVVFHVAADYRLWVRDPDEMYRSNVEGTRSLLEGGAETRRTASGVHVECRDHGIYCRAALATGGAVLRTGGHTAVADERVRCRWRI